MWEGAQCALVNTGLGGVVGCWERKTGKLEKSRSQGALLNTGLGDSWGGISGKQLNPTERKTRKLD